MVHREQLKCFKCGEPYEAIVNNNKDFIGDNFIRWDTENHKCKFLDDSQLMQINYAIEVLNVICKNIELRKVNSKKLKEATGDYRIGLTHAKDEVLEAIYELEQKKLTTKTK